MPATALSTTPLVHPSAEVRDCRLGAYCEVGARTQLLEVELGDYSYIVNDSDAAYATIGKFCSIAAMTRINPGNHPMERASQSHFSYRASAYFAGAADEAEFFAWRRSHRVTIGHDVWIGHGAIMLPGRTVGTGAVDRGRRGGDQGRGCPTASSPATRPASSGARFPEEIAARLQRLAWWDWSHERLRAALPDFQKLSIDRFLDRHEQRPPPRKGSKFAI